MGEKFEETELLSQTGWGRREREERGKWLLITVTWIYDNH
jgi:hypothetical protein